MNKANLGSVPVQTCILSVVVCTHNRADVLEICLKHVTMQAVPPLAYEVIVVDNNSQDNTRTVVANYVRENGNLRYVLEKNLGISHARNRGYREATGEYVAYLDDDAKVPEDWLRKALDIIRIHQPDVFGGSIYPFYLSPKPEWFDDKYEIRIHHPVAGWLPKDNKRYLSGSNMIFRRSLLEELDGFKSELGPKGTDFSYGEDTEIVARALHTGRAVYYSPDLVVYHLVPEHKMELWFQIYSNFKWGKDNATLWKTAYELDALCELAGLIDSLMSGINTHLRTSRSHSARPVEQLIVEDLAPTIRDIGRRVGFLVQANEIANLRSKLRVSQGASYLSLKECLKLNLRLLRKTKAINMLIDLIKGRRSRPERDIDGME